MQFLTLCVAFLRGRNQAQGNGTCLGLTAMVQHCGMDLAPAGHSDFPHAFWRCAGARGVWQRG